MINSVNFTMGTIWIILLIVAGLLLVVLGLFFGAIVERLLPCEPIQVGDKVEIFTDGVWNRTATISGVTSDRLFIYETLPLPLSYRGKFYAVGTDIDGVEFWYLRDKHRNVLVPFAEAVRTFYKRLSDTNNLMPVTSESDLLVAAQRQVQEAEHLKADTGEIKEDEL